MPQRAHRTSLLARGRAALDESRAAFAAGERDRASDLLARVVDLVADHPEPELRALHLDAVALQAFWAGNIERCLVAQAAAIDMHRASGDRRRHAEALVRDAGARMVAGRADVEERLREARREADTIGDTTLLAQVATTAAMHALRESRTGEALVQAAIGAAAARHAEAWSWLVTAEGTRAAAAMAIGDPETCIAHTSRAMAIAERHGQRRSLLDLGLQRVRALTEAGDTAEAAVQLDELTAAVDPDDRLLKAKVWLAAGLLNRRTGHTDEAKAALQEALARFRILKDRAHTAETLAALITATTEDGEASAVGELIASFRELDPGGPLAALTEARAATRLGSPEDVVGHAQEAVRLAAETDGHAIADEALVLAVEAAKQAGDLARAFALCEQLSDARADAGRLRRVLWARGEAAAARTLAQASALDEATAVGPAAETARALRAEHGSRLDSLAHTARNRFAAIAACGDLMSLPRPPRPREELANRLHDTLASLGRLLDDAAAEAREPGEQGPSGPTPLAPLAYRVVDMFAPRAAVKGIDLQVRVLRAGRSTIAATTLRDALDNLVSNALKFCSRGQAVRVIVDSTPDSLTIAVQDDGPGIPEQEQGRLFMPRSRLSPRPTDGESSTGLGLWLTRDAIQRAGGRVSVQSEQGRGSTFTLHLPRR